MKITVRKLTEKDIDAAAEIWNSVVEDGRAFPQTEMLDHSSAKAFFDAQTLTAVACDADSGRIGGLYILHPNNVGRCGHMANASYAVSRELRGMGIGEALVRHCLASAAQAGFRLLVFNAVVASNKSALALYAKLGFVRLGTIPGGFCNKDGVFEDIIPHYKVLG